MATIRRYGNGNKKNFVICFKLSNGKKYFIADRYLFLSVKQEMTLEDLKSVAKLYTYKGSKIITTRIWKEFGIHNEEKNGGHIVHSSSYTLEHLERYSYNCNGKKLLNIL